MLRRCSASLVPFRKIRLTARILPLKVFEALAAGAAPVCTSFSKDVEDLAATGLVRIADGADDFAHAIEAAVVGDNPQVRQRLIAFGREQTWEARWRQMAAIIAGGRTPELSAPAGATSA